MTGFEELEMLTDAGAAYCVVLNAKWRLGWNFVLSVCNLANTLMELR